MPRRPFYAAWRDLLQRLTADLRTSVLPRRLRGGSSVESAASRPGAAERDGATYLAAQPAIEARLQALGGSREVSASDAPRQFENDRPDAR